MKNIIKEKISELLEKEICELETILLKEKIYEHLVKIQGLERGPHQHDLLRLLKSELSKLEIYQEVLDNGCGEIFRGALPLVETMLEILYGSETYTNEHGVTTQERQEVTRVRVPESDHPPKGFGTMYGERTSLTADPDDKEFQQPRKLKLPHTPDLRVIQHVLQRGGEIGRGDYTSPEKDKTHECVMNVGDSQYTTTSLLVPRGPPARSRDLSGDKRDSGCAEFPIFLPEVREFLLDRKEDAAEGSTETGLLGTDEETSSPSNESEHAKVSNLKEQDRPDQLPQTCPDAHRDGYLQMAAPARFPYDRGKADLAAECQDRKWLDRVTNCLPTDDDKMTIEPGQNWIPGQSHAKPQTCSKPRVIL